jgi:hypothetical protein
LSRHGGRGSGDAGAVTRRVARLCALKALVLCLGCATPISVCRMDTLQSHPEAIQEVRRILLEQLAEAP